MEEKNERHGRKQSQIRCKHIGDIDRQKILVENSLQIKNNHIRRYLIQKDLLGTVLLEAAVCFEDISG